MSAPGRAFVNPLQLSCGIYGTTKPNEPTCSIDTGNHSLDSNPKKPFLTITCSATYSASSTAVQIGCASVTGTTFHSRTARTLWDMSWPLVMLQAACFQPDGRDIVAFVKSSHFFCRLPPRMRCLAKFVGLFPIPVSRPDTANEERGDLSVGLGRELQAGSCCSRLRGGRSVAMVTMCE